MLNIITNILSETINGIQGTLSGSYTEDNDTYSSSIDEIDNLYYKYAYDTGVSNIPLLVIMHGWSGDADDFTQVVMQKFASYKYFVLAVGMRGRNSADGLNGTSDRELMDIYDAVNSIIIAFPNLIDSTKLIIAGWSGGSGNVIGMCSKFPDFFNTSISNFCMSDYYYDGDDSWGETNGAYSASIIDRVNVPITSKNEYLSRKHNNSVQNYQGYLYMFHDEDDSIVDVLGSQTVNTQMIAEGKTNYEYSETNSGYEDRWLHGLPTIGSDIEKAEAIWKTESLTRDKVIIPISGTVTVTGYIVTKRFTVWLGDGVTALKDGTNRSAMIVYDVPNDSYTVTPILESGASDVEVKIIQFDGKTATQTISTETVIIVL